MVREGQPGDQSDPDLEVAPKLHILNGALEAARQREAEDRQRRNKVKCKGDKDILVWEIYGKIAEGIQKFKDIGDGLVNIDPIYIAAPWALCRGILMVGVQGAPHLEGIDICRSPQPSMKHIVSCFLNFKRSLISSITFEPSR
jgi:hypothetical protein